jgi:hypothetical protein
MRCFYTYLMALCLVAALVLPPFAMLYAEQTKNGQMLPCHGQMTQQEDSKSPCGQDFTHCKCCVVNAAILMEMRSIPQERYTHVPSIAVAIFSEHQPELLVPPPKIFSIS